MRRIGACLTKKSLPLRGNATQPSSFRQFTNRSQVWRQISILPNPDVSRPKRPDDPNQAEYVPTQNGPGVDLNPPSHPNPKVSAQPNAANKLAKHERKPTLGEHPELYPYIMNHINESPDRAELRKEVELSTWAVAAGAPDQASFLAWLIQLMGAKRVIEVGVFRGSTTLAIAEALPENGRVIGLDISDEFCTTAKTAWKRAGVDHKIDLRMGDAKDTMKLMASTSGQRGSFDLVFIDADKVGYDCYYEAALVLVRKGGVIAVDNVLWGGKVLNPAKDDADTNAIVALNEKIKGDSRVSATMLPIADGCYLCRKL